jgi:hypothetical protein
MPNSLIKLFITAFLLFPVFAHSQQVAHRPQNINPIAEDYVRLGLNIWQYDHDFVIAYYGPDSLKPKKPALSVFPEEYFIRRADTLATELKPFLTSPDTDTRRRAKWISMQLRAFKREIKIFSGEFAPFDVEAADLFGVKPPAYPDAHYHLINEKLGKMMPGPGTIAERERALFKRFTIPKEKLTEVYLACINESRKRTLQHFSLPANEDFRVEYVTEKPWAGYNYYQGNFKGLIQINTDYPVDIRSLMDLACHEGYPGHHAYNSTLEQKIYRDKGYVEISMYALFTPQALIAEGTAEYGVDMAYTEDEKIQLAKNILLPLAGLDTAGITTYIKTWPLLEQMDYGQTEITRGFLDLTMSKKQFMHWYMDYGVSASPDFMKQYRSYIINYSYGKDLVAAYISRHGGAGKNKDQEWAAFYWLLSHEVNTDDLKATK